MEENKTMETPKENQVQEQTPKKSDKMSNMIIVVLIFLILVVLAILFGYQYLNKENVTTKETDNKVTTQNTQESTDKKEIAAEEESATQPETETTKKPVQADIDKSLQSLDSLDLSGIENDYGEDSLEDL